MITADNVRALASKSQCCYFPILKCRPALIYPHAAAQPANRKRLSTLYCGVLQGRQASAWATASMSACDMSIVSAFGLCLLIKARSCGSVICWISACDGAGADAGIPPPL